MKRVIQAALLLALALAVLGGSGCSPQVEVRTGTKVVCTYGEVISDDIHTVKVPAKDAGKYKVATITKTCDRHAAIEALYRDAQKAITAGDLVAAKKLLGQVVAQEPGFGKAQSQLDTIAKGDKPAADTTSPQPANPGTSTAKPGEAETGNPAESLLAWAPDTLTGFSASKAAVDPLNVARDYVPVKGSDVVTLVIAAEQYSSPDMAEAGLTTEVKNAYSKNKSTLNVNGHEVYFGTDGRRFAAMGFVDGAVMVVVEMSGKTGKKPVELKSALEAVVEQLP